MVSIAEKFRGTAWQRRWASPWQAGGGAAIPGHFPAGGSAVAAFALGRGEVFVSPFDLNVEQGRVEEPLKPILRVGAPVFGEGGGKNRRCLGKQRNR